MHQGIDPLLDTKARKLSVFGDVFSINGLIDYFSIPQQRVSRWFEARLVKRAQQTNDGMVKGGGFFVPFHPGTTSSSQKPGLRRDCGLPGKRPVRTANQTRRINPPSGLRMSTIVAASCRIGDGI